MARRTFRKGAVLMRTPVMVVPSGALADTPLGPYPFAWSETEDALAMGEISFLNHSASPNAEAWLHHDSEEIEIRARRAIRPGTEITIDYGPDLWFEPHPE